MSLQLTLLFSLVGRVVCGEKLEMFLNWTVPVESEEGNEMETKECIYIAAGQHTTPSL